MPEVLRGVGRWLAARIDDAEAGTDPTAKAWLEFVRDLGVEPADYVGSETDEQWIDEAVVKFAEKNRFVNQLLFTMEGTS